MVTRPAGERDPADSLDARLAGASEMERERLIREHFRPLLAAEPSSWIGRLAAVCARHDLRLTSVRSLCADLAWQARQEGQPYPSDQEVGGTQAVGRGQPAGLVGTYVAAYRLRFDYRFAELGAACPGWLAEHDGDALLLAFGAFAALGSRAPQGMALYRAAITAPNADRRSRHTCLAAMWFAYYLPNQAQEILDLSSAMMAKGETDANVFYRRAAALRKLGRFEQAIEDVDRAISMLGVGENPVHQDYVRERELIVSSMEVRAYVGSLNEEARERLSAEVTEQISAASVQLAQKVETAQQVVSDGLLKIIEILGLFLALIGFVAGSGAIVLKAQTVGDRLLSMTLVLLGSLLFFTLLRLVTTFRRR